MGNKDLFVAVIISFICGVAITLLLQQGHKKLEPQGFEKEIPDVPGVGLLLDACMKYSVPFDLALSLAEVESNYNHSVVNYNRDGSKDVGYLQLNSLYHDEHKAEDIVWNIDTGIKHLREMYDQSGSWMVAIVRYNAGWGHDTAVKYLEKVLRGIR